MIQPQMLEGITEDVTRQMQQNYPGQKVRVFIEPEDAEDLAAGIPAPPFTVRDRAHLVALLDEAADSPTTPFTDDTLEQMRREVRKRIAHKQP